MHTMCYPPFPVSNLTSFLRHYFIVGWDANELIIQKNTIYIGYLLAAVDNDGPIGVPAKGIIFRVGRGG